jgi:hypothetical protein
MWKLGDLLLYLIGESGVRGKCLLKEKSSSPGSPPFRVVKNGVMFSVSSGFAGKVRCMNCSSPYEPFLLSE